MRVVIYAAKSTADPKGSIPQQIEDCRQHAAREGWTVVEPPESDEAKSAWTANRGSGLERAMERAEDLATEGDAGLIVAHTNRLARGELIGGVSKHLIDYARWADRAGVELHSVADAPTLSHPVVTFVMGEMSAAESAAKSYAVRRAMRKKREQGVHSWGNVYGYSRDKEKGLVPDPDSAPIVRRIFSLVAGGASQAEVARTLTHEGISTPTGRGRWNQATISALLRRRTYLGEIPADDPSERQKVGKLQRPSASAAWKPGAHEELISQDTWDAVEAANARRMNHRSRGGGRPSVGGHLLTHGMLLHASCGYAMTPRTHEPKKNGTRATVYQCSGKKHGACDGLVVQRQDVDETITRYLAEVGVDAAETLRLLQGATERRSEQDKRALDRAKHELARIEEERKRLWRDRRSGTLDDADWQAFKAEHAEEKAALDAQAAHLSAAKPEPAELTSDVTDALSLVRKFVENGDTAAVRNVISSLFEHFSIGRESEPETPPAVTAQEARAARASVRAEIEKAERTAGRDEDGRPVRRTVAEANAEAYAEMARREDEPTPRDPDADLPITESGLVLIPEPRREVLASIATEDGPAVLVDAQGRNIFGRRPLQTTHADGLTT